ncbi:MAG: hypothetical protein KAR38_13470, partial [Calditrichia bacterium]|nr:hypothetical protein [Calditrichia bacterium]
MENSIKEKKIADYLRKIQIFLQIKQLNKIIFSLFFYWLFIWLSALILIYIFQIPVNYWKYASVILLIFSLSLFLFKRKTTLTFFISKKQKLKVLLSFLINYLPQRENILVFHELKINKKQNNVFLKAAYKQLLSNLSIEDYEKIEIIKKNINVIIKFVLLIIATSILSYSSLNITKKVKHFWLHPLTEYKEPSIFQFKNLVKKNIIYEGDSLRFKVIITGSRVEKSWVDIEAAAHSITRIPLDRVDTIYLSKKNFISENVNYQYFCKTSAYLIDKNVFSSKKYLLNYIKFPEISRLEFTIIPPGYTGLQQKHYLEDKTNISFYNGSLIKILGKTTGKMQKIEIKFNKKIKSNNNIQSEFQFDFLAKKPGELQLSYLVFDTFKLEYPVKYRFNLLKDEPPVVRLNMPLGEVELGKEMNVKVHLKVSDDFGISKMLMHKTRYAPKIDTIFSSIDVTNWIYDKKSSLIKKIVEFFEDF